MNIRKKTSSNNTAARNSSIKYLVLHYTGSTHSEKGTAYVVCSQAQVQEQQAQILL